jgi:tetratricopeptide (TPR) repeat protein
MRQIALSWVILAVAVAAFYPLGELGKVIDENRLRYQLTEPLRYHLIEDPEQQLDQAASIVVAAVLGGFRGVAADMLWLKVDEYFHAGQHYRMLPTARAVVAIDPHFIEAWTVMGWHQAYNIFNDYQEAGDWAGKWRWFNSGIDWLKDGLEHNPRSRDIAFNIGWTLFDRGEYYPEAVEWLTKTLRNESTITYTGMLIGHAYERMPDIDPAIEWHYRVLRNAPEQPNATGAAISLELRYEQACLDAEAGDYDSARQIILDWLRAPHRDAAEEIANHLMATWYEQEGNFYEALRWWKRAYEYKKLDDLAERKVHDLSAKLGVNADALELPLPVVR